MSLWSVSTCHHEFAVETEYDGLLSTAFDHRRAFPTGSTVRIISRQRSRWGLMGGSISRKCACISFAPEFRKSDWIRRISFPTDASLREVNVLLGETMLLSLMKFINVLRCIVCPSNPSAAILEIENLADNKLCTSSDFRFEEVSLQCDNVRVHPHHTVFRQQSLGRGLHFFALIVGLPCSMSL